VHTPSATALLDIWEQGGRLAPAERALSLLGLGWPQASRDRLAALPIGERDTRLARLRTRLFGSRLDARVDCPACGEPLEFELDAQVLYAGQGSVGRGEMTAAGYQVCFRVPDSADLLSVSGVADLGEARDALLERCVEVVVAANGEAGTPAELPETVKAMLEQAMEEADSRANQSLALSCPACRHNWQAAFDILGFFWCELEDWAWRLLREVQCLARAYGWAERDIQAMTPWRRRIYLEMAQA
jgi:hypothetical protein